MHSHNRAAEPNHACGSLHHADPATSAEPNPARADAVDPVCGMRVDPERTAHRLPYHDRTYCFCSARCREKFTADPATYLAPKTGTSARVPEDVVYTCPMHPEIRQNGPGNCP